MSNILEVGLAAHTETDERLHVYVEIYEGWPFLRARSTTGSPLATNVGWLETKVLAADRAFRRGVYRHYKGAHYQGLGVAPYNDTEELLAIYMSLEGAHLPGPRLRGRPLAMWQGLVPDPNPGDFRDRDCCDMNQALSVPRFEYVGHEIPVKP